MGFLPIKTLYLVVAVLLLAGVSYGLFRTTGINNPASFAPTAHAISSNDTNYSAASSNNGNFTFVFHTINGNIEKWYFPASVYQHYASVPKEMSLLVLNSTSNGKALYTYDYSGLITPALFANEIGNLTNGRTAPEFVSEVFNSRRQLATYSLVFSNSSEYPAETLAYGQGDCKDFAVLMASMLEAGNIQAGYGMRVQFLYLDYPNLTNPHVINHLILNIIYKNGTSQFLESTGNVQNPYKSVDGWYFNLTCNSTSCKPLTACPLGEVPGLDGACHAECGSSGSYCSSGSSCYNNSCISCPAGYTLGTDGQCHAACGSASTYCGSGSTCYGGTCVSCSPGYAVGADGSCHQACNVGYCSSGSYCHDNSCISCPAGYYLTNDGKCYHA